LVALAAACVLTLGCGPWRQFRTHAEPPLGSISDNIWQTQEYNSEASEFVVYDHEFKLNQARLNTAGEDHVKQIAERLLAGQDFPVVVERSMTSPRENTRFGYPVHPNPQLDMQRRDVIVRALQMLGVADAEERAVVAPAFATGYEATEAARSYTRGLGTQGGYGGGWGGWGGGGGGWGGGFY
jgi:hypothetical protein